MLFIAEAAVGVTGKFRRFQFLLLTTTGRKTGEKRTAPLLYIEDGGDYAVVASFAGAPKHPAWYLNLGQLIPRRRSK